MQRTIGTSLQGDPRNGTAPSRVGPVVYAIVSIVLVAVVVRAAGLGRSAWLDEAVTLELVRSATWAEWITRFRVDQQPLAYPLLVTAWSALSTNIVWLRLCSLACGLTAVAIALRWAAAISPAAAVLAGSLTATLPILLRYSLELRPYGLLSCAGAWAFLSAWRVGQSAASRRSGALQLALALSLACMTHYTAILLVPSTLAVIVVAAGRRWRGRIPWAAFVCVVTIWILMLGASGALARVRAGWWIPAPTPSLIWATLGELTGVSPPGGAGMTTVASLALLAILSSGVVLFAFARRVPAWTAPLAGAAIYVAVLLGVSVGGISLWWPRMLVPVAIPLIVATAGAVDALPARRARTTARVLAVAMAATLGLRWIAGEATRPLEPWSQAIQLIDHATPIVVLAVPDYAGIPLRAAAADAEVAVVPVRPGSPTERVLADLTAVTPSPSISHTVALMIRVDLTTATQRGAIDRLCQQLGDTRLAGATGFDAVLLLSPDASLVPSLRRTRDDFERQVRAVFGPPRERQTVGETVVLHFGRRYD